MSEKVRGIICLMTVDVLEKRREAKNQRTKNKFLKIKENEQVIVTYVGEKRITREERILSFLKREKKISIKKNSIYKVVFKKILMELGETTNHIEL